jgi:hypothetical protein
VDAGIAPLSSGDGTVKLAMAKPDTIIIDGHAHSWRRLCELRRQQLDVWRDAEPRQPALFPLKEDYRPAAERSAAGRYREPSFLSLMFEDCPE